MEILYIDKYLAVAVKPRGVASQKDPTGRGDMVTLLTEALGTQVYCVHRLDTATEGVMVYALTKEAAAKLSASMEKWQKTYIAAVAGEAAGQGGMRDLLLHDRRINKSFVTDTKRAGVKEAILEYSLLACGSGTSLVKVRLITGRTHQIRVQFASRGMPLLGDGKYGSRVKCPLALYCASLSFEHPNTREQMTFSSLPPSPWNGFELNAEMLKAHRYSAPNTI